MENITDADYKHAKNVWKSFEIKKLGYYHDLYVQTNTLLLADIFENFRKKCIEIWKLDPAHFLSAPGLAWEIKKCHKPVCNLYDKNNYVAHIRILKQALNH